MKLFVKVSTVVLTLISTQIFAEELICNVTINSASSRETKVVSERQILKKVGYIVDKEVVEFSNGDKFYPQVTYLNASTSDNLSTVEVRYMLSVTEVPVGQNILQSIYTPMKSSIEIAPEPIGLLNLKTEGYSAKANCFVK